MRSSHILRGCNVYVNDLEIQEKFWLNFSKNIKKLNLNKPLHGKIKAKFGAKYLRENRNWSIC